MKIDRPIATLDSLRENVSCRWLFLMAYFSFRRLRLEKSRTTGRSFDGPRDPLREGICQLHLRVCSAELLELRDHPFNKNSVLANAELCITLRRSEVKEILTPRGDFMIQRTGRKRSKLDRSADALHDEVSA